MNNNVTNKGVRYITVTAMLSAVAYVLMFIDFPIPFLIPSFIQMDMFKSGGYPIISVQMAISFLFSLGFCFLLLRSHYLSAS